MSESSSKFVTTKQLSELINTPIYTIQQWVREQKIPAYSISIPSRTKPKTDKVRNKFLFDVEEVIRIIKKSKV